MNRRGFLQALAALTAAPSIPAVGAAKGYVSEIARHTGFAPPPDFTHSIWVKRPSGEWIRNVRVFNRRLTEAELVELTR